MNLQDGTTAVFRIIYLDNLRTYLARGALHAPNHWPTDGQPWRDTHRNDVQTRRANVPVLGGPGGVILDYVPFYFGHRSPMLFQLHTGQVPGYTDGQGAMIYLVASAHEIAAAGCGFVFYDGHALARLSNSHHDLADLTRLDWQAIEAKQWSNTRTDPDRMRRKQAEFLVHQVLPWDLIRGIVVLDSAAETRVQAILDDFPSALHRTIVRRPAWYY